MLYTLLSNKTVDKSKLCLFVCLFFLGGEGDDGCNILLFPVLFFFFFLSLCSLFSYSLEFA